MTGRAMLGLSARAGLALTPDVRLALELLHLPGTELKERVAREAAANPLLEIEEEPTDPTLEEGMDPEDAAGDERSHEDAGFEVYGPGGEEDVEGVSATWRSKSAIPPRGVLEIHSGAAREHAAPSTLSEHLRSQFRLEVCDPAILAAGEFLIGCVDERGYLGLDPTLVGAEAGLPVAAVEAALGVLQALDPPGVGARDLQECLLLQLRARDREGSLAWRLVEQRFEELVAGRRERAARGLGAGAVAVSRALEEIRSLRPHPGWLVGGGPVRYIYPDLSVRRMDGGWLVQADDRTVPRLRCVSWGRDWASSRSDPDSQNAGREWFTAARRLVRALERRRLTLVRVMECILEEQGEFFERGLPYLRPLNLRTVASRLGLHESTVARVVRGKHVQTPRGLLPLRFFFSGGLRTEYGPAASSRAVQARIRALVAGEDQDQPLTDAAIAGRLADEGIRVARRTVSKYRMSMRIERAPRRRPLTGPRVRRRGRSRGRSLPGRPS